MTKNTKTIATSSAITATALAASTAPATNVAPAAAPIIVAPTKADKGRTVFNGFLVDGKLTAERKVVIKALQSEAGLTEKGAATYYQNMKKKAGLVVAKVASAPATA